jgi:membrane associated rhomboid family serine protease
MRTHHRRSWPLFVGVAILAVLGLFVLKGIASGVVLAGAIFAFIGACIYALAGEKVSDGVGGIGGPFAH